MTRALAPPGLAHASEQEIVARSAGMSRQDRADANDGLLKHLAALKDAQAPRADGEGASEYRRR